MLTFTEFSSLLPAAMGTVPAYGLAASRHAGWPATQAAVAGPSSGAAPGANNLPADVRKDIKKIAAVSSIHSHIHAISWAAGIKSWSLPVLFAFSASPGPYAFVVM